MGNTADEPDSHARSGRCRGAAVFAVAAVFGLIAIALPAGFADAAFAVKPQVGLLDYRPAVAIPGEYGHDFDGHGDPDTGNEYVEPMADVCYKPQTGGGTVQLRVDNPSGRPLSILAVKVDGEGADALTDRPFDNPAFCTESDLRWWRAEPTEIPAHRSSVVTLNGTRFAPGGKVRFKVQTDAGSSVVQATLNRPAVRIGAVRFSPDLQRVRIYLDPGARLRKTMVPARVLVGNRSFRPHYVGSLYRGRTLMVTARVPRLLAGRKVVISVRLRRRGRRKQVTAVASAATTVFPSRFPVGIGVGFGSSNLPDESDTADLRDAGIDTLVAFDQNFSFDDLLANAHAGGFSTVIGSRMPNENQGETHSDTSEALLQEMPRLAQDSTVVGFYPYDEPDIPFAEPVWRYRTSAYLADLLARVREADPTHPSFVNLWSPNAASEYGAIPDIGGWDHYPLGRESLALESAAEFARTNRAQTSPNPFWVWSQAMPFEQGRVPSAGEMRVYNGLAVGGGAGGLIWFTYQDSIASQPEWDEISSESRVLAALRHQLAEGYVYSTGKATAPDLNVSSVAGPRLSFLAVSNLDYRLGGTSPSQFTQRTGLDISWKLPPWLVRHRDLRFAEVTPGAGLRRLGPKRGLHRSRSFPNRARVELDQLESARWFIAAPAARIDAFARQLNR